MNQGARYVEYKEAPQPQEHKYCRQGDEHGALQVALPAYGLTFLSRQPLGKTYAGSGRVVTPTA